MDPLEALINVAFLLPIYMVCVVRVFWWAMEGEIDPLPAIVAGVCLIAGFCFAAATQDDVSRWICVVSSVSLIVMFPFASNFLDRHELREINAEQIDRAFLELSLRPDNFPAWFKLSDSLFQAGYHGHAIALAEQTLERIPSNSDPFQNRSMRDMYQTEALMIRSWRRDATNPARHRPVRCPKCGHPNPPGTINCLKCEIPYLLLLSRKIGGRGLAFMKLVVGWAILGALIPICAWWGTTVGKGFGLYGLIFTLAASLAILYWIFRDPTGQPDKFRSFS